MELCLLNLLILIDCFCIILTLVCSLRACHMLLTRNHMFIREIWRKFTSFVFWNFEISLVFHSGEFKISKKWTRKFIPNFPLQHVWWVARFVISQYLTFAWSFKRMRMHTNAFFYLHVVFIRLHELTWHTNGSIKWRTFESHSNG